MLSGRMPLAEETRLNFANTSALRSGLRPVKQHMQHWLTWVYRTESDFTDDFTIEFDGTVDIISFCFEGVDHGILVIFDVNHSYVIQTPPSWQKNKQIWKHGYNVFCINVCLHLLWQKYENFPGMLVFFASLFFLLQVPSELKNITKPYKWLHYIIFRNILFNLRSRSQLYAYAHLRREEAMSKSPSAVGFSMAVPIFIVALRLTNHWALVAYPTVYHFPAICEHRRKLHEKLDHKGQS